MSKNNLSTVVVASNIMTSVEVYTKLLLMIALCCFYAHYCAFWLVIHKKIVLKLAIMWDHQHFRWLVVLEYLHGINVSWD